MLIYRKAEVSDLLAIVALHQRAFPGFFLTRMGGGFLYELYSAFCLREGGILIVAVKDNVLVGFVAGAINPDLFFSRLRSKRGLFFLIKSMPALVKNPILVFRKLISAFFYQGDKPVALSNAALLSSLAVDPAEFGRKIGSGLVLSFENSLRERAVCVYLTTDAISNARVNNFYINSGYKVDCSYRQSGGRVMNRYIKKLDCATNTSGHLE